MNSIFLGDRLTDRIDCTQNQAEGGEKVIELNDISQAVIEGNAKKAKELTLIAIEKNVPPETILHKGLVPGMDVVGQKFKNNEYYVPEVLIAARAMNAALDILRPKLATDAANYKATVVICTVKGDLHDIGKNIAAMMLEGAGFRVIDLGIAVPTEKVVEAVKLNKPAILGLSALLTTTMTNMKDIIEALEKEGLKDSLKVIVGGAPITEEFAKSIGADGYAPDATIGVQIANALIQGIS